MKNWLALGCVLVFSLKTFGQVAVTNEDFTLEIKSARKIGAVAIQFSPAEGSVLAGKGEKKIQPRVQLIKQTRCHRFQINPTHYER